MEVQVNGERSEIPENSSLEDLVRQLSLPAARIAIELNRRVVRRDAWGDTRLNESDRIEIVHFVGGGSEGQPGGEGNFPAELARVYS